MNTNPLEQLATSALMGVARKPPVWPVLAGPVGELITKLPDTDTAGRLLQTAGILALVEEFAFEPLPVVVNTLIIPPAPQETLSIAHSPRLRGIIGNIIRNEPVEIQIELLELLAVHRLRFPPEYLPMLFDNATRRPQLRDALSKLQGHRQLWLAKLNKNWAEFSLAPMDSMTGSEAEILAQGTSGERIAALRRFRNQAPEQARQWLEAALPQASAQERQEFTAILFTKLSIADSALLEMLLKDRSKVVRKLAGQLLSCLPESDFAQRMGNRLDMIAINLGRDNAQAPLSNPVQATTALNSTTNSPQRKKSLVSRIKRIADTILNTEQQRPLKIQLVIELPAVFDAAWASDGVEEQAPQGTGGNKAFWLRQLVALTPLSWWSKRLGCSPEQIVENCMQTDWQHPLIQGLIAATINQNNADWAYALLKANAIQTEVNDGVALLKLSASKDAEAILTTKLKDNLTSAGLMRVLQQAKHISTWSAEFGYFLLGRMREHIEEMQFYRFQEDLALRLPLECLAEATTDWDKAVTSPALKGFLHVVKLRQSLHQELASPCA